MSIVRQRFEHWDSISRKRPLEDWESIELERAVRQMEHDERRTQIRAQAAPPGSSRRRAAR